jgi:hypothetical protein
VVAQHALIRLLGPFERKRFGHRTNATSGGKRHRVFGIDRRSRRPPADARALPHQFKGTDGHGREIGANHDQPSVGGKASECRGHGLRVGRGREDDVRAAELLQFGGWIGRRGVDVMTRAELLRER